MMNGLKTIVISCLLAASFVLASNAQDLSRGRPVATASSGHANPIQHVALSHDGRWLASGAPGSIKLWDVASGRMLRTLPLPNDDNLSGLALSPDDRRLVANINGLVIVWDPETGEQVKTFRSNVGGGLIFSGQRQVLMVRNGRVLTWDIERGVQLAAQGNEISVLDEFGAPSTWAVSPDQKLLAFGFGHNNRWIARVEIVELATGRVLNVMDAHTDDVNDVSFSPDGRLLASASSDKTTRIWNVATGALVNTFKGQQTHVLKASFSNDGGSVVSTGSEQTVYVWETATGQLLRRLKVEAADLAFSTDGAFLAVGSRRIPSIWNANTGEQIRAMRGDGDPFVRVLAGPEDKWFSDRHFQLRAWDAATGQLLRNVAEHYFGLPASKPDVSGRWLHVESLTGAGNFLHVWNAATEQDAAMTAVDVGADASDFSLLAISPDAALGAIRIQKRGAKQKTVQIWDTRSFKRQRQFTLETDELFNPEFSPDGKLLIAVRPAPNKDGSFSGISELRAWGTTDNSPGKVLFRGKDLPDQASFAPDGRSILIWGNSTTMVDTRTGRVRWNLTPEQAYASLAIFSPDGRTIVTNSFGAEVRIRDTATGALIRTLANPGYAKSLQFVQGGRKLVVGNDNDTFSIWDPGTGALLATTVLSASGEWMTVTPEGFFASSERGADLLYVVRGFEIVEIQQVYQSLYRPDLVREKLAGDPRGFVRAAAAQLDLNRVIASGSAPELRLSLPGRGLGGATIDALQVSTDVEISDRGGGIGRVEWRVNGVTSAVDNPPPAPPGEPARLTRSLVLDRGANEISVVAYNSSNLIASVPARLNVASVPPAVPQPGVTPQPAPIAGPVPKLFLLVAGVNAYADKRIELSYAVSDAREVARGFSEAAGNLYQAVEVKLLTDAEVTRDKLDAAFGEIAAKAQATDVFVLYLAGHGKTVDGRYYFIPQDFRVDGELDDSTVNPAVRAKAIAQDELQRWFASIPSRRSVILFDTCESGTLTGDAAATQQLERGAANDRLARATGRSIITASTGKQDALEGYHGHGLFTYEMLDALNRADGDGNGSIEVTELAAYVYAGVSELSLKVFRQQQAPQMKITANYPLAKQTRILQDEVAPLAEGKPAYQLQQAAQLQIQPGLEATVVRSISAKTPVTVLENRNGWALIAAEGGVLGYVAARDLAPLQ